MAGQFSFGRKAILMKNRCSTCQGRITLLFFSTSEIEAYLVPLLLAVLQYAAQRGNIVYIIRTLKMDIR